MSEVPIMVMPWHRPDPCKPLKMQTDAAFKSSYLDYLATLRMDSPPLTLSLSTIAGTIGPASNKVDVMIDMMQAGMSVALVPLALGTRQDHMDTIANIRTASLAFSNMRNMIYPLGIAVQTKGPGLRLGGLVKDIAVTLPLQHKVTLTTDKAWRTKGTEHYLYINFPDMCHVLKEGDLLLVGNGIVILKVESMDQKEVKCVVVAGGVIQSFMAVTLPDVPLNLPPLTDEDVDDLRMAAHMGVDIVLLSNTQTAELVKDVRNILDEEESGSGIKLWAQVESNQAMKNLECILEVADAIVFSRISLLQDVPPEKLFLAQKIVLSTCNKAGVPVFVSSHFLPTMQVSTTPAIAELYDVTSAILDGVDGFVLRNTVSHGKHPDLTIKTLTGVCVEAEAAVWHHQTFSYLNANAKPPIDPTHSIAIAAVETSLKASATVILLATTSGRSAQLVARYRPRCPIIAITRYGQVARQLNSWRAVIPLHYVDPPLPEWTREVDIRFQFGIEFAKHKGIVRPGDVMVLLNGWRKGAGFTNTIRVVYASESFPWVYPHKLPEVIPEDSDVYNENEGSLEESVSKTGNAGGEPGATESRCEIKKDSHSQQSPSIVSRIRSLEEEFKNISIAKSKEIADKTLLKSTSGSLKTDPSATLKKSQDRTTIKTDREHPQSIKSKVPSSRTTSSKASVEQATSSTQSDQNHTSKEESSREFPKPPGKLSSETTRSTRQSSIRKSIEGENTDNVSQVIREENS